MKKDREDLLLKCQLMLLSMIEEEVVVPIIHMETYMNISNYKDECVEKLFELTNKETPIKPNYINDNEYCSQCDFKVTISGIWNMNYCSNCGQKIDWGDKD